MTEDFVYKGEWFLPTAKDDRVSGVLTFDKVKGITLELFGGFGNFEDLIIPKFGLTDVILGITSDSKRITLYNCFLVKSSGVTLLFNQECGFPSATYKVRYAFEGTHIETIEQFKFKEVISEIYNLDEWIKISGFVPPTIREQQERFKKKEASVHYKLPDSITFNLKEGLSCCFDFAFKSSAICYYQKNYTLTQCVRFIINSKVELEISTILKKLYHFQNFLILALYDKTHISSIYLYNDDRFLCDIVDGKTEAQKIILYFSSPYYSEVDLKNDRDMLFSYHAIKDDFPSIIKCWYEKYDLLEPALNLVFEQFYNKKPVDENTFLNLAQAIETFHARTCNHKKMPEGEYSIMKKEILSVIPQKYQEWMKSQLMFGNYLNLHDRLTEIVAKCSNTMIDKIIPDKNLFIKQVKWSRNYYTHYSADGKKNALKGRELFYLSQKLKLVMVCVLLIEIGFSPELMAKLLENVQYRFAHLERT